jgi:tetratricopeptide (TPR) repeat protein
MSYLLETLGRGLVTGLTAVFEGQFTALADDEVEPLAARFSESPTSADLATRLGLAYLRRWRLAEARRAFETALELAPAWPLPALGLACVCDELGRLDEAIRYLSIAQARDPENPAIAFAIGLCHERREQTEAAIANYRRALALCPELRNARERLAAIALVQGRVEEAARHYECLAELEPGDVDVLIILATLLLQCKQPQEAAQRYQQALTIEPDLSDEPLSESEALLEEGRLQAAIETLEKLVARYPGMAPFRVHLGDLYVRAGRDADALEQYRAALEAQPDLLEATVKLGTQHLRSQRYADAAQAFNRAVELNDRLMLAFVGLGLSQHAAGSRHEALATFDLAASLEPSTALLFAEAARLHLKAEQQGQIGMGGRVPTADDGDVDLLREALRRHERALQVHPNRADLHYHYGLLLRQMGRSEEAVAAFRRAVAINPQYAKALIKLGLLLKELGQVDEAVDVFQRALLINREYVDVHYQLGLLFAQRSRFELAVEEFERAVAGNAGNLSFRANLALALQNIGMVDRAAATWRAICELCESWEPFLDSRERILRKVRRG